MFASSDQVGSGFCARLVPFVSPRASDKRFQFLYWFTIPLFCITFSFPLFASLVLFIIGGVWYLLLEYYSSLTTISFFYDPWNISSFAIAIHLFQECGPSKRVYGRIFSRRRIFWKNFEKLSKNKQISLKMLFLQIKRKFIWILIHTLCL